jgi:hypothetical protein
MGHPVSSAVRSGFKPLGDDGYAFLDSLDAGLTYAVGISLTYSQPGALYVYGLRVGDCHWGGDGEGPNITDLGDCLSSDDSAEGYLSSQLCLKAVTDARVDWVWRRIFVYYSLGCHKYSSLRSCFVFLVFLLYFLGSCGVTSI